MRRWDYWGGDTYPAYDGYMKGADTANEQRKEELAMQKKAFNEQMSMLTKLRSSFDKYLTKNIGFDPAQKAAMTTQFLNSNDQTFNQAGSMVREALGARGNRGGTPIGGDVVRGLSGLLGARAGSQSSGLLDVNLQDAAQAITNRFNAGNLLSGNAATLTGTQGVAGSSASSALQSYIQAKNTGFLSSFMNSFGGQLGKTLGGANASPGGGWFGMGG